MPKSGQLYTKLARCKASGQARKRKAFEPFTVGNRRFRVSRVYADSSSEFTGDGEERVSSGVPVAVEFSSADSDTLSMDSIGDGSDLSAASLCNSSNASLTAPSSSDTAARGDLQIISPDGVDVSAELGSISSTCGKESSLEEISQILSENRLDVKASEPVYDVLGDEDLAASDNDSELGMKEDGEHSIVFTDSLSDVGTLVQRSTRPRRQDSNRDMRVLESEARGSIENLSHASSPAVEGPPKIDEDLAEDRKEKGWGSELKEISALAVPALGSVIADPLMSLVDTGCVGQLSSLELAALGPNTAIFNFVFQVFAFLGIATTNLIASNTPNAPGISEEERRRRKHESGTLLSNALTIALISGIACCIIMETIPVTLLKIMGASPEMLGPALSYLRVRAIASPAVMVMCVSQGACLGQQDAWTPLKMFLAAGAVNLVGDVYLILFAGMGIAGAAWATMVAQYLGACFFLVVLHRRGQKDGVPLRWRGFPTLASLQPFVGMSGALVSRTALQMTGYAMLTCKATVISTIACAAHQVTLQVFWFFSYFPEPLSITAQSLIARDSRSPTRVKRMAKMLVTLGITVGLCLGVLVSAAYLTLPRLFTSDPLVASAIKTLCPQAFCSLVLLAIVMVMDGISIGSGDFGHLPRTSLVASFGCWAALTVTTPGQTLGNVWWAMVVFFALRFIQHILHIFLHWRSHPLGEPSSLVDEKQ